MITRPSRTNGWMLAIVAAGILSAAYVASVTGGDLNPTTPPTTGTMQSLDEIYQAVAGQVDDPSISQVTGPGAIHIAVTGQTQGAIAGSCTYKGRLGTSVVSVNMTETSLRPDLEPLAAGEHYWFMIYAYNASDMLLGYTMHAVKNTYGWGFNFQVCPSCVRADINRDCQVNLLDFAILAADWLVDTR